MMTAAIESAAPPVELEPDNSARLAIFDAMFDALGQGKAAVTLEELFDRVIGRLRMLVPRELHNTGERKYLEEKLAICIQAGMLSRATGHRYSLAPDPQAWIRYPDDSIRRYTPGLIAARERLDATNASLRASSFDVTKHLPHHKSSSAQFRALVRSMEEHGFLKQCAVFRYPDGSHTDGVARIRAAAKVGVEVKWLEMKAGDPETTRMRRRDTPLNRILLALDSNATRLNEEQRQHVLDQAAEKAGRSWPEIEADLIRTHPWRAVTARSYTPTFEVTEIPFDGDGSRTIQVTADHKIHVTSLLRASGLAKHKFDTELKDCVTAEKARVKGGGPPAVFARAADMVDGLEAMLAERREHRRKVSPEWEVGLDWLRSYVRKHRIGSRESS
jgi:hypothetical protein